MATNNYNKNQIWKVNRSYHNRQHEKITIIVIITIKLFNTLTLTWHCFLYNTRLNCTKYMYMFVKNVNQFMNFTEWNRFIGFGREGNLHMVEFTPSVPNLKSSMKRCKWKFSSEPLTADNEKQFMLNITFFGLLRFLVLCAYGFLPSNLQIIT